MTDDMDTERERFPRQYIYFLACDQWLDAMEDEEVDAPPPATAQHLAVQANRLLRKEGSRQVVKASNIEAALLRWREQGVAIVAEGPLRFVDYTDDAYKLGITEVKRLHRSKMIMAGKQ